MSRDMALLAQEDVHMKNNYDYRRIRILTTMINNMDCSMSKYDCKKNYDKRK